MVLLKASKSSRRIGDGRFDEEDMVASCTLICAEEGNLRALHKLSALHKLLPNATRKSLKSSFSGWFLILRNLISPELCFRRFENSKKVFHRNFEKKIPNFSIP